MKTKTLYTRPAWNLTGLAAALAFSTIAGFGAVGLILSPQLDLTALFHYAGFMFSAILLGLAFLSLAVMLSVFASDRTRASGLAIGTWFFFVLVFDLLILGMLVVTAGDYGGAVFPYLLLLNPADVFRVLNVFTLDEVRTLYGLATVFPEALSSPTILGGVMLAWIVGPLAIAIWRFER